MNETDTVLSMWSVASLTGNGKIMTTETSYQCDIAIQA